MSTLPVSQSPKNQNSYDEAKLKKEFFVQTFEENYGIYMLGVAISNQFGLFQKNSSVSL